MKTNERVLAALQVVKGYWPLPLCIEHELHVTSRRISIDITKGFVVAGLRFACTIVMSALLGPKFPILKIEKEMGEGNQGVSLVLQPRPGDGLETPCVR